jgi:hypothetical protein
VSSGDRLPNRLLKNDFRQSVRHASKSLTPLKGPSFLDSCFTLVLESGLWSPPCGLFQQPASGPSKVKGDVEPRMTEPRSPMAVEEEEQPCPACELASFAS